MVKSKSSMTASTRVPPIDAQGNRDYFESLREAFRRIVRLQEDASENSVRARHNIAMATAAEALAGTERGFALINDPAFKSIKRTIEGTEGTTTFSALSDLERRLSPGTGERPMWMEVDEWAAEKASVQADFAELAAKGYTKAETAAGIRFYSYLRRRK